MQHLLKDFKNDKEFTSDDLIEMSFLNKELSQLARDKGFDEPCWFHYKSESGTLCCHFPIGETNSSYQHGEISAPLYQQIIDWFRDQSIRIYENSNLSAWAVSKEEKYDKFTHYGDSFTIDQAIEEAFKLI